MKTASKNWMRHRTAAVGIAAVAAGGLTLLALPAMSPGAAIANARSSGASRQNGSLIVVAQADEDVTPAELEKYISVYKAMQRNHRLTVEQAATAQGLTVRQFRDLEQRVQRNNVARDAARRALSKSAAQATPPVAGQKPNAQH